MQAVQVLLGLRALASKHDTKALDAACETALTHGVYRLRMDWMQNRDRLVHREIRDSGRTFDTFGEYLQRNSRDFLASRGLHNLSDFAQFGSEEERNTPVLQNASSAKRGGISIQRRRNQ